MSNVLVEKQGVISVPCAMCAGHGCEPQLVRGIVFQDVTGEPSGAMQKVEFVPCWWCDGTGRTDAPGRLAPCAKCGRERMYAAGEAYCPTCTHFTVA